MTADLHRRAASLFDRLTRTLIAETEANPANPTHWTGHLSASALSTAVATIALGEIDRRTGRSDHQSFVHRGLTWLAQHANPDGGWGDTTRSRSNLSTTALGWAAFGAARADATFSNAVRRSHDWILRSVRSLERLVPAIEARYGSDRTFSVPIILTLALSGRLGPQGWRRVRPLPFELASLPRAWFGALQLPVVSYALPALIALGQAIHHHAPSRNPITRCLRRITRRRTSRLLISLQPDNGGFLEATPLTAFVTMSLASMGQCEHPVAVRAADFLRRSVRPDGSWPIDTNLATWVSTLAIKALSHQPDRIAHSLADSLRSWLLGQQYRSVHPYTGAPPGGWAWTDLPGGVPDADDTAGALLALYHLTFPSRQGDNREGERPREPHSQGSQSSPPPAPPSHPTAAITLGVQWLLNLQNRDGGIPTFCRGWGRLPFDRSAPDLTAHALRAWAAWTPHLPSKLQARVERASRRACAFLRATQRPDGSWVPLWFGNEHAPHDENPVYGTALVLRALLPPPTSSSSPFADFLGPDTLQSAIRFLLAVQNPDGGWGGARDTPSTIEETSLALAALAMTPTAASPCERGLAWLTTVLDTSGAPAASPIGLYFARLWYWESSYPVLFATDALGCLLYPTHPCPPSKSDLFFATAPFPT